MHDTASKAVFHLVASKNGVRDGLQRMRAFLERADLEQDACGTAEIVVAEALNNVAEHAYELRGTGDITMTLQVGAKGVSVDIVDRGLALPDFILPEGRLPSLKQPRNAMPEGGFGWYLIRNQTDVLSYERRDDCNHLHLHLPHKMR